METWQVLVGVAALMVVYVLVSEMTGSPASPVGMGIAVVFGLLGWFLGRQITERLS